MGMKGIFHYISHCDHFICFVIEQGRYNKFIISRTKKGEEVENIKSDALPSSLLDSNVNPN